MRMRSFGVLGFAHQRTSQPTGCLPSNRYGGAQPRGELVLCSALLWRTTVFGDEGLDLAGPSCSTVPQTQPPLLPRLHQVPIF
jgi:hypothetical protein